MFVLPEVSTIEFPCGALTASSPLYIERPPIESLCYQNLKLSGSLTRIKGPRNTGKSSLLVRLLAYAQSLNYQTVLIDFQSAEEVVYSDLSRFLRWFCTAVARQLNLSPCLDEYWDDDTGSKLSATLFFEDYLLKLADGPVVLALNEVNRVFEYPLIARDFLPLLRFWFEQAKQGSAASAKLAPQTRHNGQPEVAFQKLRTLVVHSTEIYVSLNIHQSPFNVGLPIQMSPFTVEQSQQLAERFGVVSSDTHADQSSRQSLRMLVGGHPYLLSIAFYHLSQRELPLSELLIAAPTLGGIYRHHLQSCLERVKARPELIESLKQVMTSDAPIEIATVSATQLSSMGLVTLEGSVCRPTCELYRLFFLQQGLPEIYKIDSVQQLKAENEKLKVLANLDELTQLSNRRVFNEQIDVAWDLAIRQCSVLSLIMIDIDFFKCYNDTYGHLAGDFCLKQVAQVLFTHVRRTSDTVARYGGEEFALILPDTTLQESEKIAEDIRLSIQALDISHDSSQLPSRVITSSIGVASVRPQRNQPVSELITAADTALYVSKQQGRNRVTISHTLLNSPIFKGS